jgi:hypothetical protein
MFSALKKVFTPKPKVERVPFVHATLGEFAYSEEEEAWLSDPKHGALGFCFHITGDEKPDARLLPHAESVAHDADAFRKMVGDFLESEADRMKPRQAAIRELKIDMVCLFWPERPDDGMIYFTGGDSYGLWRCDYQNGKPIALGYDS